MKIDSYLLPCTKLKSKWIKDLNIKPATLNLIEKKVGSTLERIGTGNHFLNITPAVQTRANFSPIISVAVSHQDIERIIFICQQVTCEQYKAINAKWLTKVHGSSESNYI